MSDGKNFEKDFISSFPPDVFTYRLRDSASSWGSAPAVEGGPVGKARFTPSNICDFIAVNHYKHETLFLELKSTKSKSLPLSNLKSGQIKGLYYANKYEGVKAYFVINFRTQNRTFMLCATKVKEFFESETRKSIPIDYCEANGIEIEQKKKVSRFAYNLSPFLKDTVQ